MGYIRVRQAIRQNQLLARIARARESKAQPENVKRPQHVVLLIQLPDGPHRVVLGYTDRRIYNINTRIDDGSVVTATVKIELEDII